MKYEKMIEEAIEAIKESSKESSVYIGCDSIRYKDKGRWKARYSTVIVLHINSKNGGRLFYNTETQDDYGQLKIRLLNEAGYAIRAAADIVDYLDGRLLEIHLDLNADPKHKSNVAVKEACGYVLGATGIEAKIKPYSWAAAHAADHAVRGKRFH